MTAAPLDSANWIVGRAAVIRCSDVIRPSFTGTFRSSRISTRLPARSRSAMRRMDMCNSRTDQARIVPCRGRVSKRVGLTDIKAGPARRG